MEKTKKLTKRDLIGMAREIISNSEDVRKDMVLNYLNHEEELLDKKASNRTATKTQQENELIKQEILNALAQETQGVTISELQAKTDSLKAYSNQKLSALFKQLCDSNIINKVIDKKKSYFSIAE